MADIPADRSESSFEDYKQPYTKAQAVVEANRCLFCFDAPCIQACPTSIDIPGFIRKIATDNVRGSARTILESNVLGMSCARVCPVEVLCVGDCVYNELGVPPIQIGKLQRFATDTAFDEGWTFHEAGPDTGKSVGIVGGGPAALACAHRLRRFGHRVTIYEKRHTAGGLNVTGVAPYKMKADRGAEEVDFVLGIGGIEVKTGVSIPGELSWDELRRAHDAVFLAFGLGPDSVLHVPGSDLEGVAGAVEWIERMKLGHVSLDGVRSAVVVGGGNTAMDVIRELRGLGVPDVALVYRGDESVMSGYSHEWSAAKDDGVRGMFRTLPTAWLGEGGKLRGMRAVRMDERKQAIPGSEHEVPVDLALIAVGQAKLGDLVAGLSGVVVEKGRIVVGPDQATGASGVWAGGDCANGGKEVVNAVAEGRDAAVAIDQWLRRS